MLISTWKARALRLRMCAHFAKRDKRWNARLTHAQFVRTTAKPYRVGSKMLVLLPCYPFHVVAFAIHPHHVRALFQQPSPFWRLCENFCLPSSHHRIVHSSNSSWNPCLFRMKYVLKVAQRGAQRFPAIGGRKIEKFRVVISKWKTRSYVRIKCVSVCMILVDMQM